MLYHANATRIYLLSRSSASGDAAIKAITTSLPHPSASGRATPGTDVVRFVPLDLSDLSSIQSTAEAFLGKETRLDVLWHNAGIMVAPEGSRSPQDQELTFATNVLGPFLLQHFLTPVLLSTASDSPPRTVRVCWAGSGPAVAPPGPDGIQWEDIALRDAKGFAGRTARYMQSKAANVLLGAEMQARYGKAAAPSGGIVSCAFNPGAIRTDLARHAPRLLAWVHNTMAGPARNGALVELFCGFAPQVAAECEEKGRCFVVPIGKVGRTVDKVEEGIELRGSGKRLWDLCDGLVEQYYKK